MATPCALDFSCALHLSCALDQVGHPSEWRRRPLFARAVGPEDFDLIIDSDHFETGVARMSAMIGRELNPRREAVLAHINAEAYAREAAILADGLAMEEIGYHLRCDVQLFDEIQAWPPAVLGTSAA